MLCAASLGVNASCLISTSCVLAVLINSPSLGAIAAQYALILIDHVVHRSSPSCSPEHTFGFVKEFRVNQAQTSSLLSLCRRSSLCCQLLCHCIKLRRLQRYQVFQLLDLFCCCHDSTTTLPLTIVSSSRKLQWDNTTATTAGQNECSATMHDTCENRQRQKTTQTGANDKMTFEPWSFFMIRMHQ